MRKFFWEAIEEKLKGEKGTQMSGKQMLECMGDKWDGKKEKLEEACQCIKEMTSIYEADAHAKKFIDALDEATSKICEVMMTEGYDPKDKNLISIIASSKKIEGEVVDEKKEKEGKEEEEKEEKEEIKEEEVVDEKKEKEGKEEEEKEEKEVEEGSDYKVKLKVLAQKRKERMANLEEKKEPEKEEEKEEEVDEAKEGKEENKSVPIIKTLLKIAKKNGFDGDATDLQALFDRVVGLETSDPKGAMKSIERFFPVKAKEEVKEEEELEEKKTKYQEELTEKKEKVEPEEKKEPEKEEEKEEIEETEVTPEIMQKLKAVGIKITDPKQAYTFLRDLTQKSDWYKETELPEKPVSEKKEEDEELEKKKSLEKKLDKIEENIVRRASQMVV